MGPITVRGSRAGVAMRTFCCVGNSGDGSWISASLTEKSYQSIVTVRLPQDQILRQDVRCEILPRTAAGIDTHGGEKEAGLGGGKS